MNGELTWNMAEVWARRILKSDATAFDDRVRELHRRAFGREATAREIEWAHELLRDQDVDEKTAETNHGVWTAICHTMLNRKELIYVY